MTEPIAARGSDAEPGMRSTMGEFARAFKVTFPDGFYVDGVQFPSGRCVLDDNVSGLIQAATSLEELPMVRDYPLATVVWEADRG